MRTPLFLAVLALSGCQQAPILPTLTPYRMDIQQGNFVTQDMMAKLKPGMTRSQVRFLLGTPLVVDPFRTDRWDYFYVLSQRGQTVEQRRIVVIFRDDKLARIEGDVVPAGGQKTEGGVSVERPAPSAAPPAPGTPAPAAEPQSLRQFRGDVYVQSTAGGR